MNLESRVRFPCVPFYFCFHFVEVFHWLSKFTDPQTQFLFPLFCFVKFFLLLLHFFEINFCSPWFTTNSRPIIPPRAILYYALWALYMEYGIGFWSYIHRLDQGPKTLQLYPYPGPSRHDEFQIIGDISTLRVLSQVKLMLNQTYIYSRLKIPLYIPGSIKTHRIYTGDVIYPARITMKLYDMIQVYSSGSTVIMHMHYI